MLIANGFRTTLELLRWIKKKLNSLSFSFYAVFEMEYHFFYWIVFEIEQPIRDRQHARTSRFLILLIDNDIAGRGLLIS